MACKSLMNTQWFQQIFNKVASKLIIKWYNETKYFDSQTVGFIITVTLLIQLLYHFMSWQLKQVFVLGQKQITVFLSNSEWKNLKHCDFQYSPNFSLWLTQTVKSWQVSRLSPFPWRCILSAEGIGAFNEEIKLQQKFSARFQSCVHLCYHCTSRILVLFTLQQKSSNSKKEKNYFFMYISWVSKTQPLYFPLLFDKMSKMWQIQYSYRRFPNSCTTIYLKAVPKHCFKSLTSLPELKPS